ncbi:MAG: hypothetical protein U0572_09240 [Phycisphaerales bacterium]
MTRHISSALVCTALFIAQPSLFAQSGDAMPLPSSAANPKAVQLQLEIDALNSMTDAMGPMVNDADTRVKLMTGYISEQKLDAAFATFKSAPNAPGFNGLTFNQSYQVAVKDQQLRGNPVPSTTDVVTLENEAMATQTLVQSQWVRLNSLHDQVVKMTAFLESQKQLDAYTAWAQTAAAKRLENYTPPPPPTDKSSANGDLTPEQRAANIARYQEHLARLRQHWDEEQYSDAQPDFKPSQGYFPQNNGISTSNASNDYYSGSYWNGYADPYYDVWGYPAGAGAAAAAAARNYWNRGGGRAPAIAPMADHPMMRGGGRR